MISQPDNQRGAIAMYIVLLVLLTVTSAALILSSVLSRQQRTSLEVVATERAFYAANSGIEEGFARLLQGSEADTIVISGQVEYEDGEASFDGRARLTGETSELQRSACIESQGIFRGRERRIAIAPPEAACEF